VGFTQRVEYRLEERGGDTRLSVTSDTRYENAVARLLEPVITRAVQKQLEATLERLRVEVEAQPVPR
jgi:carbon monoxide dehydrogenase subunit G